MRRDAMYFGALGALVTVAGVVAMLRGIGLGTDPGAILGVVTIAGTFLLWRGFVLAAAGAMYLSGATDGLEDRRNQATVVMASLMIWIVAGSDLLSTVLGAIPGSPDVWVASSGSIVAALGPPYTPAMLLAPFALVALQYAGGRRS